MRMNGRNADVTSSSPNTFTSNCLLNSCDLNNSTHYISTERKKKKEKKRKKSNETKKHALPSFFNHTLETDPSVVHQNVDPAKPLERLFRLAPDDVQSVGHVELLETEVL